MLTSIRRAGIVLVAVLLVACERPTVAKIETPPSPSTDPSAAFPKFDVVYRDAGYLPVNDSTDGKLSVDYFRFFADGTVRHCRRLTGRDNKVTKAMSAAAFGVLAHDSGDEDPMGGKYEIKGGSLTLSVSEDFVYRGRPGRTIMAYTGKIDGDQILLMRVEPKTGKRMSPEFVCWPVAP